MPKQYHKQTVNLLFINSLLGRNKIIFFTFKKIPYIIIKKLTTQTPNLKRAVHHFHISTKKSLLIKCFCIPCIILINLWMERTLLQLFFSYSILQCLQSYLRFLLKNHPQILPFSLPFFLHKASHELSFHFSLESAQITSANSHISEAKNLYSLPF